MLSKDMTAFFAASVGADAAFIGLLFVALTVAMARPGSTGIAIRDRLLAESSYTAFVNIFFVSFVGLIPQPDLRYVFVIVGIIGVISTVRLARAERLSSVRDRWLLVGFLGLTYLAELSYGVYTLARHIHYIDSGVVISLIFTLYGIGLGRAWALTGLDDQQPNKRSR